MGVFGATTGFVILVVTVVIPVAASFAALSLLACEASRPTTKESIRATLQRLDVPSSLHQWADGFMHLFVGAFGHRLLSWKCIWRSAIASLTASAVLTWIWVVIRTEDALYALSVFGYGHVITFHNGMVLHLSGLYLLWPLFNLVPDYLSLGETRFVLKQVKRGTSLPGLVGWLLLDLLLTAMIATAAVCVGILILLKVQTPWLEFRSAIGIMWDMYMRAVTFNSGRYLEKGIFFYSTFLTSVWLWLTVLGIILGKGLRQVDRSMNLFRGLFDIDLRPCRSFALLIAVSAGILGGGIAVVMTARAHLLQ